MTFQSLLAVLVSNPLADSRHEQKEVSALVSTSRIGGKRTAHLKSRI